MQPVEEPCSILRAAEAILARKNETCFIVCHFSIRVQFINILTSLRWKGNSMFLEKAYDLLEG
jgi:hypothetical protein